MKAVRILPGLFLLILLISPALPVYSASVSDGSTVKGGAATKPVSPAPADVRQPAAPAIAPQPGVAPPDTPLLQIKRVYVFPKDEKLRVVIRNTGGGRLSSQEYMTGRLVVTLLGTATRWEWPLAKVNPRRDHFLADTTFNTGKSLTASTRVMVQITGVNTGKPWVGNLPDDAGAQAKPAPVPGTAPAASPAPAFQPVRKPAQPTPPTAPEGSARPGIPATPAARGAGGVAKAPGDESQFQGSAPNQMIDGATVEGLLNPSVTLMAPNGGEEWSRGAMHEIVWKTFPGDRERRWEVMYSLGYGQRVAITDPFTYDAASGTYRLPWFIANDTPEGEGFGVRIQEIDGPRVDRSDAPFSIVAPRSGDIRLVVEADLQNTRTRSGNEWRLHVRWRGDEDVCRGSVVNLSIWSTGNEVIQPLPQVRGTTCNGATEIVIPDRVGERLQNEPFFVSASMPPSCNGASARIDYAANRPRARYLLQVDYPSSGDNVVPGANTRIYWRDGDPSEPTARNREFWLLTSHTERHSIPLGTIQYDGNRGLYYMEWHAGANMSVSGGHQGSSVSPYAIQIRATDSGQESTGGNFSVWDQGLEIVEPEAAAVYYAGNYLPIRWNSAWTSEGLLELYLMGPDNARLDIDHDVDPRRGQASWLIPAPVSEGQYKLFIRRATTYPLGQSGTGAIYYGTYESDYFQIRKPALTLLRPTGQDGTTYAGDQQVPITWRHEGFGGGTLGTTLRIELLRDNHFVDEIAEVDVRDGQYAWRAGRSQDNPYGHIRITSPGHGEATDPRTGERFQVRIRLTSDGAVRDQSGYFEIR